MSLNVISLSPVVFVGRDRPSARPLRLDFKMPGLRQLSPEILAEARADGHVARIGGIVDALIFGDKRAARRELAPIAGITRVILPLDPLPSLPRGQWIRGGKGRTKDPGRRAKAAVWVRDGFTCRYCGRRTIPPDLLKVLSFHFKDAFGWQKTWNPPTHRAYWDISTSLDHVLAVSGGGDWREVGNLVTACYRCQEQKNDRSLEALGWQLRRPKRGWDGLTKSYEALYEVVQPDPKNHRSWIAAFNDAWHEDRARR